ncbi:LacI family transcriptional regulator [Cohnella xylanilytica]|uniref:LacI family DNA-binding transcriptional regulator n=1 Tax=Cohnella xylanilytica TaxID=557555 RepID=A0A841U304_9BACL|nr:LacI family DNA-binding transcriptional regulator [Cohnella xylanilytica]MBB6693872.1 LacI family DNA-binding transcriptional regulator [Cohnella xylanilytica]GIO14081.1 LacI family transcriptional regulator [Cohnella xylanilytica]
MKGMKKIAELTGVSVSTVSNVLNGRSNVSQATKERVLQVAAEYGYSPRTPRSSINEHASKAVVFIFSDFDREFYLKIINGISDYLSENGYDLIICTSKSSASFMRSSFASGAIVLDSSITDEFVASVAAPDFPVVLMDRILPDSSLHTKSVVVDNYPVMCELVQGLVDKGFKKFGFIGGLDYTLDNKERFGALTDTLARNKIEFDRTHYFHGNYREKSGYQAAKLMILSNALPEVVVCANDNMAIGAIKAFEENNLRVPEDISVTGFDDSEAAAMAGLTTVSIPRYESGYLAAKDLLELINGRKQREPFKLSATNIKWRKSVK